jgi:hypothetical protein
MATQAECVKVIQTETERLRQYLAALPQDAWSKPSACALWEIRDVVAHVSGVPTAYTIAITRGLQGDISPRPDAPDQSSVFQTHSQEERQQYRRALAQRILVTRERRGNDLVSVFSQGWDPFPPFIASLSAEDWHTPCHHSFGIIPVHARVHAGVFELAIHSWVSALPWSRPRRLPLTHSPSFSISSPHVRIGSLPLPPRYPPRSGIGLPSPERAAGSGILSWKVTKPT